METAPSTSLRWSARGEFTSSNQKVYEKLHVLFDGSKYIKGIRIRETVIPATDFWEQTLKFERFQYYAIVNDSEL